MKRATLKNGTREGARLVILTETGVGAEIRIDPDIRVWVKATYVFDD